MHPLTERFGAEIGLDTRGPFEVSDIALVEAALNRFAVLVFPDQTLSDAQHKAFAAHFGKLDGDAATPRTSFVFAQAIPPVGGLTEFIDLRAAHDALGDAAKQELAPFVGEHPGSKRKMLSRAGWDAARAQVLPRQFTYAHRWRPGDLVMWDDRCTLQQDLPFDGARFARDMRRVTVS